MDPAPTSPTPSDKQEDNTAEVKAKSTQVKARKKKSQITFWDTSDDEESEGEGEVSPHSEPEPGPSRLSVPYNSDEERGFENKPALKGKNALRDAFDALGNVVESSDSELYVPPATEESSSGKCKNSFYIKEKFHHIWPPHLAPASTSSLYTS